MTSTKTTQAQQRPCDITGHEPTCQCMNCRDAAAALWAAWWAAPVPSASRPVDEAALKADILHRLTDHDGNPCNCK